MVLSGKKSYEFKPLFELIFSNLRADNAASGGEEMLRLRTYEKLQSLVERGVVKKTIKDAVKSYTGILVPLRELAVELKAIRDEWVARIAARALPAQVV